MNRACVTLLSMSLLACGAPPSPASDEVSATWTAGDDVPLGDDVPPDDGVPPGDEARLAGDAAAPEAAGALDPSTAP